MSTASPTPSPYHGEHTVSVSETDHYLRWTNGAFKHLPGFADGRLFVYIFGIILCFLVVVWFFAGGRNSRRCFRGINLWRLNSYGPQEKSYRAANGLFSTLAFLVAFVFTLDLLIQSILEFGVENSQTIPLSHSHGGINVDGGELIITLEMVQLFANTPGVSNPQCNRIIDPPKVLPAADDDASFAANVLPSDSYAWRAQYMLPRVYPSDDTSGTLAFDLARTVLGEGYSDAQLRNEAVAYFHRLDTDPDEPLPFDGLLPAIVVYAMAGHMPLRTCKSTISVTDFRLTAPHHLPPHDSTITPPPPIAPRPDVPGYLPGSYPHVAALRFSIPEGLALYNWTATFGTGTPGAYISGYAAGLQPLPPAITPYPSGSSSSNRCPPVQHVPRPDCFVRQNEVYAQVAPAVHRDRRFFDSRGEKRAHGHRPTFPTYLAKTVYADNRALPEAPSGAVKPVHLSKHSATSPETLRDLAHAEMQPNHWRETIAILFDYSSFIAETVSVPKSPVLHIIGALFGLFLGVIILFRTLFVLIMGDGLDDSIPIRSDYMDVNRDYASSRVSSVKPYTGSVHQRASTSASSTWSSDGVSSSSNPIHSGPTQANRVAMNVDDAPDSGHPPVRNPVGGADGKGDPGTNVNHANGVGTNIHRNAFAPSVSAAATGTYTAQNPHAPYSVGTGHQSAVPASMPFTGVNTAHMDPSAVDMTTSVWQKAIEHMERTGRMAPAQNAQATYPPTAATYPAPESHNSPAHADSGAPVSIELPKRP